MSHTPHPPDRPGDPNLSPLLSADPVSALVQRYLGGERTPEVLGALSRISWEAYHDPWEAWRATPALPRSETDKQALEGPAHTLRVLSGPLIARALEHLKLPFRRLTAHHYRITPDKEEGKLRQPIEIRMVGSHNQILQISSASAFRAPLSRFEAGLEACNDWNLRKLWPRAAANAKPKEHHAPGFQFELDFYLDTRDGITPMQLRRHVQIYCKTAADFWDTVQGFKPEDDLDLDGFFEEPE